MSAKQRFQPRDRSLPAFKEWLEGKYRFNPKSVRTVATRMWYSERDWIENWRLFWAKVDGLSRGGNTSL